MDAHTIISTVIGAGAREKAKLDGEMNELPQALQHRYNWIVAGKQVGARWRQYDVKNGGSLLRYLGTPSRVNAKDCPLCLWLGVCESTRELLVLLTHSVKIGSKNPRRMFQIVPSESLKLDFRALSLTQVPESLFERPSDTRSAHSNGFLHINFTFEPKQRSTVIMPARRYDGIVRGTAFFLLDGLKSLSEARGFDLYFRFDSYAQNKLQTLRQRINDMSFRTPIFDVKGMYRGHRDGGFDLWQEQGWQEDVEVDASSTKIRKRKASNEPDIPPRYQPRQAATEPPPAYHDNDTALADTPKVTCDGSDNIFPPETAQAMVLETAVPDDPSLHATLQVARSCSPVVHLSRRDVSPRSETSRVCETPLFDAVAAPATVLISDGSDSPLRNRFFEEMPSWLQSAWKICPLAHYKCMLYLLAVGAGARAGNVKYYEKARTGCTLRLVSSKAKACDPDEPDQAHRISFVKPAAVEKASLLNQDRNLITWVLMVDPLADTHQLFSPLIMFKRQLTSLIKMFDKDSSTLRDNFTDEEFGRRYRLLMETKARIVIEACFQYGTKALRSREVLVEKIRNEVDTLKNN